MHDKTLPKTMTMNITTGIFGFFILCCAYSTQYWVKKCRDELKEIKEDLKKDSDPDTRSSSLFARV